MKYFWALMFFIMPLAANAQFSLSIIEMKIEKEHPVANINGEELKQVLASNDSSNYIIFDTRKKQEYNVSRIQSAIYVDPDMKSKDFLKKYGEIIGGKHLVFYCSVGYRSSIFVERLQKKLLKDGTQSLSNLRGGIFRWYNEGNTVMNDDGITDEVHSFDDYWGQLLIKRK